MISHDGVTFELIRLMLPALGALLFIAGLSRIAEPVRHRILAVMAAGFSTLYVAGGLGPWELLYVVPAAYVAYRALDSYRFVALAWLMHPVWDLVHHFAGHPLFAWMPVSSLGCAVFDPIVAVWTWRLAGRRDGVPVPQFWTRIGRGDTGAARLPGNAAGTR